MYGDLYEASLLNQVIAGVASTADGVKVTWLDAEPGVVRSELYFQDANGQDKTVYIPDSIHGVMLKDVNTNLPLTYRTLFLPDSLAIDTFYTNYEIIQIK